MTMSSPYVVVLSGAEDRVLAARVASGRTEYRDRLRAQIVLDAAHGVSNAGIARSRNVCVDTVRTWRQIAGVLSNPAPVRWTTRA